MKIEIILEGFISIISFTVIWNLLLMIAGERFTRKSLIPRITVSIILGGLLFAFVKKYI